MTNILKFPEQSRIQEEASHWLIRLDGGGLSENDAGAFSVWLNVSQQHRDAIIELCQLWDNLEILSELSPLFPYNDRGASRSKRVTSYIKRPAFMASLLVASLFIMASLLVFDHDIFSGLFNLELSQQQAVSYQTAVGEKRIVILEDGSVAKLNTNSLILVFYSDKQRNIHLVRGEVYFEVMPAPDRPFVVRAGAGSVQAVGTAFSVRLKDENLEVTVTDGKVEVATVLIDKQDQAEEFADIVPGEYLTTLGVGQSAEISDKSIKTVKTIELGDVVRKLSWQHGMLEFKGEPLDEVVKEISRYTNKKIIIIDPSIRDIRIGGYFKTGEVDSLLTVLRDGFQIDINRVSEDLIYLTEGNPVRAIMAN